MEGCQPREVTLTNEECQEGQFREMERLLKAVRDEVKEKYSLTLSNLIEKTDCPFTHQILEYPAWQKYRAPPVEMIDGARDPTNHLEIFKGHMAYQGVPDAIICWAFHLNLLNSA